MVRIMVRPPPGVSSGTRCRPRFPALPASQYRQEVRKRSRFTQPPYGSRQEASNPPGPQVGLQGGHLGNRTVSGCQEGVAMADVVFVALTLAVFAVLWLVVKAVERL
jgi:hypothetical protein